MSSLKIASVCLFAIFAGAGCGLERKAQLATTADAPLTFSDWENFCDNDDFEHTKSCLTTAACGTGVRVGIFLFTTRDVAAQPRLTITEKWLKERDGARVKIDDNDPVHLSFSSSIPVDLLKSMQTGHRLRVRYSTFGDGGYETCDVSLNGFSRALADARLRTQSLAK